MNTLRQGETSSGDQRRAAAWELLAEGHAPVVFEWLPLIARRELMPGVGKIADGIWNNLISSFQSQVSSLGEAIHAEERAARRAQKNGEKPSKPPAGEIAGWLRVELAGYAPTLAWGILCLLQMRFQMRQQPAEADAAGKLYLSLREENYSPDEIIKLARTAERKAGKLNPET
jgi:hypothetical protein